MTILLRLILLACIIILVQMMIVHHIYVQSRALSMFANLPHRYLGGIFWATQLQPQREDYAYSYLMEWLATDKDELMIEGQTRPVVPMLAVRQAMKFPEDPDLQKLRKLIMIRHLKGKSNFQYPITEPKAEEVEKHGKIIWDLDLLNYE